MARLYSLAIQQFALLCGTLSIPLASPLKRGTFIYCTLLQRKALYTQIVIFLMP
ncbi:MAG: hypothetical protein RIM23_25255 [Coleofasciculus sp. G3-WIS-01]|uniref:hypothetical protein n=1 Tax=Coleofasciculus sp. G3-WIS-01 TaxID=3069528 RepID=UPI0032F0C153